MCDGGREAVKRRDEKKEGNQCRGEERYAGEEAMKSREDVEWSKGRICMGRRDVKEGGKESQGEAKCEEGSDERGERRRGM